MKKRWVAAGAAVWFAVVVLAMIVAADAFATALSANRDTPERTGERVTLTCASNHIYAGSIVCEGGSATAVVGADASGYVVVGRAEQEVDNTGASYSATQTITVRRGTFRWANGGSFTDANIGDFAYVSDDQTVTTAAAATYDIIAGVIIDVDSDGVWVDTFAIGGQGAASVTTLAASGAATLGSTLSVAGAATLTGNAIANEVDARTATALLLGKATATAVTIGASDANTTVAGDLTVTGGDVTSARYNVGTNGYFQITGNALQFVGYNGFTNAVEADITQ
jgi:hypothetical protein